MVGAGVSEKRWSGLDADASQSRGDLKVNCSTTAAPSTSCVGARAAGKPCCWPSTSKRDLGWMHFLHRHWTASNRASSRNRRTARVWEAPCNGLHEPMTWGFADGCSIRLWHPPQAEVTQPTAGLSRRLQQSATSIHPAQTQLISLASACLTSTRPSQRGIVVPWPWESAWSSLFASLDGFVESDMLVAVRRRRPEQSTASASTSALLHRSRC